jgi:hypothetical protein
MGGDAHVIAGVVDQCKHIKKLLRYYEGRLKQY